MQNEVKYIIGNEGNRVPTRTQFLKNYLYGGH